MFNIWNERGLFSELYRFAFAFEWVAGYVYIFSHFLCSKDTLSICIRFKSVEFVYIFVEIDEFAVTFADGFEAEVVACSEEYLLVIEAFEVMLGTPDDWFECEFHDLSYKCMTVITKRWQTKFIVMDCMRGSPIICMVIDSDSKYCSNWFYFKWYKNVKNHSNLSYLKNNLIEGNLCLSIDLTGLLSITLRL